MSGVHLPLTGGFCWRSGHCDFHPFSYLTAVKFPDNSMPLEVNENKSPSKIPNHTVLQEEAWWSSYHYQLSILDIAVVESRVQIPRWLSHGSSKLCTCCLANMLKHNDFWKQNIHDVRNNYGPCKKISNNTHQTLTLHKRNQEVTLKN